MAQTTGRLEGVALLPCTAGRAFAPFPPAIEEARDVYVEGREEAAPLRRGDGADLAGRVEQEGARQGVPQRYAVFAGRLFLEPVPDAGYRIRVLAGLSGRTSEKDSDPAPTLAEALEQLPPAFTRPLTDYVMGEWLQDSGAAEAAGARLQRARQDIQSAASDPNEKRRHTRPYMPLGGALAAVDRQRQKASGLSAPQQAEVEPGLTLDFTDEDDLVTATIV
jgi:hypothetical protein